MNGSLLKVLFLGILGQQVLGARGPSRLAVPEKLVEDPGLVPNASFEAGRDSPADWRLEGTQRGAWVGEARTGRHAVSVTGTGKDFSYWRCTGLKLKPRTLYRFSAHMKVSPGAGGGCLIMGPSSNNRDYRLVEGWTRRSFVFVTPDSTDGVFLRCGQWHVRGTGFYDDLRLRSVVPIYSKAGALVLGEGERIAGGRYVAEPRFAGQGSNAFRGLVSHTANFNSHRWVFGPGGTVTYRHRLGQVEQTAGKVSIDIGYYRSGALHVEASSDGREWTEIGQAARQDRKALTVPAALYPSASLWVRLRASGGPDVKGDSAPGNLQVYRYRYEADLRDKVPGATGSTSYVEILREDPSLRVTVDGLSGPTSPMPWVGGRIEAAKGIGSATLRLMLRRKGEVEYDAFKEVKLDAGSAAGFKMPFRLRSAGTYDLMLAAGDAGGNLRFAAQANVSLPILHAADYGYPIESGPRGDLWWCEGTYKVSRHRAVPRGKGKGIRIVAAGNEYEPFQLIVRPRADLKQVRVDASDLAGSAGRIDKANIAIDRVAWVYVHSPTDSVGCIGHWPDPLPHCDEPFDVPADTNQPLWITVHVPAHTKPGEYKGTVTVRADGGIRWEAPVSLRVLGFSLPKEAHVFATFGFSVGNVRKYHNLKTDDELRRVYDLYMKNFAAHRISPYDPMALDPIRVKVETGLGVKIDFTAFDRAARRYLDGFGFTRFRLPVMGMGGGTFHSRRKGSIGGCAQGTPEYDVLMKEYLGQVESHLASKGWLDKAYVYWFDEPAPKDYGFVNEGMAVLKRSAPGLTRMLTEQPEPAMFGSVDLWCPLTASYRQKVCRERQAKGEHVMWYVCTGPKEPYATLFIDHPAIDFRMWLWQTYKYDVEGILIWQSNYWTSGCAYPEPNYQNPWQDPMSYVSGYSTPVGTKRHWGNGDGRFLYPPNRKGAADKTTKYLTGPINSIRWEILRDGIEDFEYLWQLRHAVRTLRRRGVTDAELDRAARLTVIPETICKSLTEFTWDPQPLYEHRLKIGLALERLLKEHKLKICSKPGSHDANAHPR